MTQRDDSAARRAGSWAAGLLVATALGGCVPAALAVGGAGGVTAAQDRSVGNAATDLEIRTQINDLWFKKSIDMYGNLSLSVNEGRVLITGVVPTEQMRLDAVRLAWQANGVKEVINEVKLPNEAAPSSYGGDLWITSQLRSKLVLDHDVKSVNYSIETVAGVVYLMGIAQNQGELDRVTAYASNIPYVQNVVSYVRLKDQPAAPTPAAQPAAAAPAPTSPPAPAPPPAQAPAPAATAPAGAAVAAPVQLVPASPAPPAP